MVKKYAVKGIGCLLALLMLAAAPAGVLAEEVDDENISYDQVASDSEKATVQTVGVEGMYPIFATDLEEGVYEVEVESSSAMFRVDKAVLTVADGEMTAVLTMGGTGYLKVFMGTGVEAAQSDRSAYIGFEVDADGKHTYTIPVEALDTPIACAAFSKNKEKWYDRDILFRADSLPEEAVLVELPDYEALEQAAKEKRIEALRAETAEAAENTENAAAENAASQAADANTAVTAAPSAEAAFIEMEDGEYAIPVTLTGGSGRSTVNSPAVLIVRDGRAYAQIEWSSSNYDYMKVGGEKFLPIQEEGYSTFEIPITVFNEPMPVIADTTAMSTPHEVDYELTFQADSIMDKGQTPQAAAQRVVYMVIAIVAVCLIVPAITKRRKKRRK